MENKDNKHEKPVKSHFFMFKAWAKSIQIRYLIDSIFIFIMGAIVQLQMTDLQSNGSDWYVIWPNYVQASTELQETSTTDSNYDQVKANFDQAEKEYLNISYVVYDQLMLIYVMFAVYMAYPLKNIVQVIFARLRNRSWSSIYAEFILSLGQLVISTTVLYRYLFKHRYVQPDDQRYYELEVVYSAYYRESFLDMTLALGLYVMIQWARIIFVFKVNSFVGPILNIIQSMLKEILKFIIIYIIILIIFASSSRLFFVRVKGYQTNTEAILTLFSASLGSYNFSAFTGEGMVLSPSFGYYFLIIYLIVTNVVLLNFIIAILSNTYNNLSGISKALYHNEVVKVRNVYEHDKYYGSLISLPIPLNLVLLPFVPFIIIFRSKKLNMFLLHVSYLPVLFIGTLVFSVLELIMLPISYFALLYQNLIDIWEKGSDGSSRCVEATQFFQMIFKGPLMLVFWMCSDIYEFVKSLYASNLRMNNQRAYNNLTNLRYLDMKYFDILHSILFNRRTKLVDMRCIIRELGEKLNIHNHVRNIIYQSHDFNNDVKAYQNRVESSIGSELGSELNGDRSIDNDTALYVIKQYNLCKRFIVQNSIPLELFSRSDSKLSTKVNTNEDIGISSFYNFYI